MITENPNFYKILDKKIERGLVFVGGKLKKIIKDKIGIKGPPRSLPGEPPRIDTGKLHRSIQVDKSELKMKKIIIGSDVHYAETLEAGTLFAQRPYLRNSFTENTKEIIESFRKGSGLRGSVSKITGETNILSKTASDVSSPISSGGGSLVDDFDFDF